MAEEVRRAGHTVPCLFDETHGVAKAYRAPCSPYVYIFDKNRILVYCGLRDDSRPGNGIG